MKKYQECNRLEKIWRSRWYLAVPFMFIYHYLSGLYIGKDKQDENGKWKHTDEYFTASPKLIWELMLGEAQIKMNYVYDHEDVMKIMEEYSKKYKEDLEKS
jgi:hypothetical protein